LCILALNCDFCRHQIYCFLWESIDHSVSRVRLNLEPPLPKQPFTLKQQTHCSQCRPRSNPEFVFSLGLSVVDKFRSLFSFSQTCFASGSMKAYWPAVAYIRFTALYFLLYDRKWNTDNDDNSLDKYFIYASARFLPGALVRKVMRSVASVRLAPI